MKKEPPKNKAGEILRDFQECVSTFSERGEEYETDIGPTLELENVFKVG